MKKRVFTALLFSLPLFAMLAYFALAQAAPLFQGPINLAISNKKNVVIIIPTGESDKATQQRIHTDVRKLRQTLFSSQTPILTDEEALKQNLSQNSLLVYGTLLGNRWLARNLKNFPIEVHADRIIAGRTYSSTGLRLISTWPNPQNKQLGMIIYTAQVAQDIPGINRLHHGETDIVIARGSTIIKAGNFVKNGPSWTLLPERLPLADALRDLDFLFQTIEEVHPNHLAYTTPKAYRELKQFSRERLEQVADDNKMVNRAALAVTAARAAAALGDGHTNSFLSPDLVDTLDPTPIMLPFHLSFDSGKFTIGNTIPKLKALRGCRLLKLNDADATATLQPLVNTISGEALAYKCTQFVSNQRTYWSLLCPLTGPIVRLRVADNAGHLTTHTVNLISLGQYDSVIRPQPAELNGADIIRYHHEGQTCIWRYQHFADSPTERAKIDAIFKDLKRRQVQNLIIDLRGNGGGTTAISEFILNYLTCSPYWPFSRYDIKRSRQIEKQRPDINFGSTIDTLASLFSGHQNSLISVHQDRIMIKPQDRRTRFTGRLFVLTGPLTYSTAADFAAIIKDFKLGTLLGEETGGLRESYGDCLRFRLPLSSIGFGVSCKQFFAPKPQPGDDRHGTAPDIYFTPKKLSRYASQLDPGLAFTLDFVRDAGNSPSFAS